MTSESHTMNSKRSPTHENLELSAPLEFAAYEQIFIEHDETHLSYLQYHYDRFMRTKQIAAVPAVTDGQPTRLLDIGAHWLHQTLLYALDGLEVTAADLPFSLQRECTRSLAKDYSISLYEYEDLNHPAALEGLPESYFDVIFFTEILEHITYNPVAMWRGIYRVLKPGGRIVVTTPNYYYWRKLWHELVRLTSGGGVGISTHSLLHEKDTAPHWKEYSRSELIKYFKELTRDFDVNCVRFVSFPSKDHRWRQLAYKCVEATVPFFRKNLHAEIVLKEKSKAIVIEPTW